MAGNYASAGSAACSSCDPGYECPTDGMKIQNACTVGTFSESSGATSCADCPIGTVIANWQFARMITDYKNLQWS